MTNGNHERFGTMTTTTRELTTPRTLAAINVFLEGLAQATGDATLGIQQVRMLTALYVHGTLNQVDLPKFTGVEKSAVARNISRLGGGAWAAKPGSPSKVEKPGLGLIEAYQEPTDRRFNMVRLTPKGRAMLEQLSKDAIALL